MDKATELLIRIVKALRFLSVLIGWAYGGWVVFAAVLERVPFYQALVWGALGSAAAGFSLWALLLLLDRFIAYRDGTREAEDAAQRFDALRGAGERELTLGGATQIWLGPQQGTDPVSRSMALVKLRQLKFAVKQGLLQCESWRQDGPDDFPGENTKCRTEAFAAFIRSRGWRNLSDEPTWPDAKQRRARATAQATPSAPKRNFVTGWRE